MDEKNMNKLGGMDTDIRQYMEEESGEINVIDLALLFLRHWVYIAAACVLVGGIFACYNKFAVPPKYQANAQIYVTNSDKVIDIQNVQLSAELTVDYEEILLSYTVMQQVLDELNLDMEWTALVELITINNPKDSHILKINVVTEDETESLQIANTLLKYGIDRIYRVVGNDEPVIIDQAVDQTVTIVKRSTVKMALIGAMLGGMAVCGFILLRYMLDNTFKDQDDVESYTGLPVLSVVPFFDDTQEEAEAKITPYRGKLKLMQGSCK